MPCFRCGLRSLIHDDSTGCLVCGSCGAVQEFTNYEERSFCPQGPTGVSVRVGTSGAGSSLAYKEKKIYEAGKVIDEITGCLDLAGGSEIRSMVERITEGELGQGAWFRVLVGACCYAWMRSQNRALSIGEVIAVVQCDEYELGNMVSRVVDHLELRLPEFDIVSAFNKVVRKLTGRVDREIVDRIRKQGVFLIQCAIKWFVTTGRRPMPVVAAVFALVAELNGVKDFSFEEVAWELQVSAVTSRKRYKELLEKLVEVAQVLPWGKNVTVKNIVKNAPVVIRYMELKSTTSKKRGKGSENFDSAVFDIGEIVSECLRSGFSSCGDEDDGPECSESRNAEDVATNLDAEDVATNLELSHECLSMVYEKFLEQGGGEMACEVSDEVPIQRECRGVDHYASEWWNGKSPLSRKLLLKDILEKDVGLETMPPSYVKGCADIARRRAKIEAAKLRLKRNELPLNINNSDKSSTGNFDLVDVVYSRKRKRKRKELDIDWEDFIIEALLAHRVKEEEIEKGYYKALLGLYVFKSGSNVEESRVGGGNLIEACKSNS